MLLPYSSPETGLTFYSARLFAGKPGVQKGRDFSLSVSQSLSKGARPTFHCLCPNFTKSAPVGLWGSIFLPICSNVLPNLSDFL